MTSLPKHKESGAAQNDKQEANPLFPVFLKLNELHTVLVGAGNVGLEKLHAILQNSPQARVTVIALTILPEVHILAAGYKGVNIIQKSFDDSDLDNADLVVAATNDNDLNNFIRQSARDRKLLINVADKPELCDFYLGSIVQKGNLKIAISTNGKSPTIAKRIKEVLNDGLPNELDTTLQQMSALRDSLSGDFAHKVRELNKRTAILVEPKQPVKKTFISAIKAKISKGISVKTILVAVAVIVVLISIKALLRF